MNANEKPETLHFRPRGNRESKPDCRGRQTGIRREGKEREREGVEYKGGRRGFDGGTRVDQEEPEGRRDPDCYLAHGLEIRRASFTVRRISTNSVCQPKGGG